MKITIEIDPTYLDRLRKWASVSRTLNVAKAMCSKVEDDMECFSESTREQAGWTNKELCSIEPALNHLHKQVQEAIWVIDREEHIRMMKRLSKIQLDWYLERREQVIKVEGYAEDGNKVTVANGRVDTWTDGEKLHDSVSSETPNDQRQRGTDHSV